MIRAPRSVNFIGRSNVGRIGATLTEVLMSLLIMSVGVVSVFTLFPLSLLSSIRATQLTNSKILEENVIQRIRTNPQIVEGYPAWQAASTYSTPAIYEPNAAPLPGGTNGNLFCVPTPKPGHLLSSSNMIFIPSSDGTVPGYAAANGVTTSLREPTNWPTTTVAPSPPWPIPYNVGVQVSEQSGWNWEGYRIQDLANFPSGVSTPTTDSVYVVDPLGYWSAIEAGDPNNSLFTASFSTRFGNNEAGTMAYQNSVSGAVSLVRHHANLTPSQANQLFWLPDTWTSYIEELPVSMTSTALQFPNTTDLSGLPSKGMYLPTGMLMPRVTLIGVNGQTATRDIGGFNQTQITLQSGQYFPPELDSLAEITSARVEYYTPRYSYLLTVRRGSDGEADVSCAVFFNRSFSTQDERVFGADIFVDPADGQSKINVTWSSLPAPLISEGNYVFDAINGFWYRIVSVSTTGANSRQLVIDQTPTITTDQTSVTDLDGGVMFLPGIVKVFDLVLR